MAKHLKLFIDFWCIFDNFIHMQQSLSALEKKAIKLALCENWAEAIATNKELLDLDPTNLQAKIRLGRAYLLSKDFRNASKMFKAVLEQDPINQIAKKNYELAKSKSAKVAINSGAVIKEPGTSEEVKAEVISKSKIWERLAKGQTFSMRILKTKTVLIHSSNEIAQIGGPMALKIYLHTKEGAKVSAQYIGQSNETKNCVDILLKADRPIFKQEKQDVRPYMKKGSIEEHEIEVDSFDDE